MLAPSKPARQVDHAPTTSTVTTLRALRRSSYSAAANQALSEKRAAAVRQALVDGYQVDGARLLAKGLGQTKPAAPNDTPEGRQSNRRVELVKQ